ncbi:hypothetical protein KC887_01255 [Candidatus Kaiserbacteria bacterium]|nr:hypothetical protein [Candidatus Kaiserbacteria bacterium]
MTLTVQQPDKPQPAMSSNLVIVETEAPPVTFSTAYYEEAHGKPPHHNARGTWRFMPPRHLGKRPFEFYDMTYTEAKKQAVEAIGERPAYGEFVLIP